MCNVESLRWRLDGHDGVSNHQPHHCLLNRLFGCKSKKTSKLRVIRLCSPHKWPVTRKMFPFHDVIMVKLCIDIFVSRTNQVFSFGPQKPLLCIIVPNYGSDEAKMKLITLPLSKHQNLNCRISNFPSDFWITTNICYLKLSVDGNWKLVSRFPQPQ